MDRYKAIYLNKACIPVLFALLLIGNPSKAQEGSQGNTIVFNGATMSVFGAHSFIAGGSGTQPGIIKTIRSAPFGVFRYASTASYSGATDVSHIDGYVEKVGNSAFIFPIGNGTKLRVAGISAPTTSGSFKAAYWFQNPATSTLPAGAPFPSATTYLGTGVTGVSTVEYWDIDGASAVNLTLSWDAASGLGSLTNNTSNNLIVVGYNSTTSKWENLGNAGGVSGTLATNGTVTANGVTPDNYSAFTFGVKAQVPDLTAAQFFSSTSLAVGGAADYVVAISNVGQAATSAVVDFFVTRFGPATGLNIALNNASSVNIDGDDFPLSNSEFNIVTTTGRFTFTSKTTPTNVAISSLGVKYVGFTITRSGGGSGSTNSTVTITNGTGGGETPINNNTIANPITKL